MNEQIREDYVRWYVSKFCRRPSHDGYESYITWQAWQAAHPGYAGESEPVGIVNHADHQPDLCDPDAPLRMAVDETYERSIQGLPKGTKLYTRPQSPAVPDGYIIVRDTTESLSTNKLSDKLQYWRAERPDEWTMDEFIHDAQVIEAMLRAREVSDD
jgi:hypothetical protein